MKPRLPLPLPLLLLPLLLLTLPSCAQLNGYRRSYTLSYITPQGQPLGLGITLDPVTRSGK